VGGIYIHIPYCKKKCSYCNFYFSVSTKTMSSFTESLLREIELTKDYLSEKELISLYLGGGTPSLLNLYDLEKIIIKIREIYNFKNEIEITIEANPDDISESYIKSIVKLGINRISIGIQSFDARELQLFGRIHDPVTALNSILICKDNGIENMNIDLIFGIPGSGETTWKKNLDIFLGADIDHLSCYNLTIEPKTEIFHQLKTKKIPEINDKISTFQFLDTIEYLGNNGYEHYEISNYARNEKYAIHNTNYWKGGHYLGLGPSANSFNGEVRQWNVSNIRKYIHSIEAGILPLESEKLSEADKYNEYIMTGLRTMWGVNIEKIVEINGSFAHLFLENIKPYVDDGKIQLRNTIYSLSDQGKLFADRIAADLFID
jgi:oxygen-independent coproporphyrinogen-3 oxidase